jgi:hypothetical protein
MDSVVVKRLPAAVSYKCSTTSYHFFATKKNNWLKVAGKISAIRARRGALFLLFLKKEQVMDRKKERSMQLQGMRVCHKHPGALRVFTSVSVSVNKVQIECLESFCRIGFRKSEN